MGTVLKFKPRVELISDRFARAIADAGLVYNSMDTDGQGFALLIPHDAPIAIWSRLLASLDLSATVNEVTFSSGGVTTTLVLLRGVF